MDQKNQETTFRAKEGWGCLPVIFIIAAIGILLVFLGGFKQEDKSPEKSLSYEINPEQIVGFKQNAFACNSIDEYNELLGHIVRREETKFRAMFEDSRCLVIPVNENFKVLSIKGVYARFIEITNIKSGFSNGIWTEPALVDRIIKKDTNSEANNEVDPKSSD